MKDYRDDLDKWLDENLSDQHFNTYESVIYSKGKQGKMVGGLFVGRALNDAYSMGAMSDDEPLDLREFYNEK